MKKKQILSILIPTFIFVILWITSSVYHGIVTSTISQTESMQITPISPNFDTKIIEQLKKREVITPIYEINGSPIISVPNSQTITPISSASAKTATQGGSLK